MTKQTISDPNYFKTPAAFRAWLEKHHATAKELLVGFHKIDSGLPSMTWPQSVDEALCFGWIDGVRRRVDEQRYSIRFTPRKPGSIWSAVNIRKMEILQAQGLVLAAGLAAFAKRSETKSAIYAFEQKKPAAFDPVSEKTFKANRAAWAFFTEQAPWYKQKVIWWVISAKQEKTKRSRLQKLIDESTQARRC
jgi:uncharacterized protein YdeI (YjbR/CyaY-like superfamily)